MVRARSHRVLRQRTGGRQGLTCGTNVIVTTLLLIPVLVAFVMSVTNNDKLNMFSIMATSVVLITTLAIIPLVSSRGQLVGYVLYNINTLLLVLFFMGTVGNKKRFFF